MGGGFSITSWKKVRRFLEARKNLIDQFVDFITHKLRVFNRLLDFKLPVGNGTPLALDAVITPLTVTQAVLPLPYLKWIRTDADLLELVTAIFESGSIVREGAKMNKKDLQQAFEQLFHHHVKDPGSKLTRLKDRKKEITPYLDELRKVFINYVEAKPLNK
jgi:hypothetical protein